MPLSGWMRREVTPIVTWFASLMRSWPLNWFSVNIVAKLTSCTPLSKFGSRLWSLNGM